jgi:hypothetical protein
MLGPTGQMALATLSEVGRRFYLTRYQQEGSPPCPGGSNEELLVGALQARIERWLGVGGCLPRHRVRRRGAARRAGLGAGRWPVYPAAP